MIDRDKLLQAYQQARSDLLHQRVPAGHWVGHLSSSALATATAVSALSLVERHGPTDAATGRYEDERHEMALGKLILGGLEWLAENQNADGGWGDTELSHSNISTTMLVMSAFHMTGVPASHADLLARASQYVERQGGIPALRRRYGRDKTFAVPILTNYALADQCCWSEVASLPFELACLPQRLYHFLKLPVVSYAIPALVAVGQAKFFHRKPWNPLVRWPRSLAVSPSLKVLRDMQPDSGGYLEAIPLTSFVVMSLASTGRARHEVVWSGVQFLIHSAREDGSWPIDTNLATWNTSLAIHALGVDDSWEAQDCLEWLLGCQQRQQHPYTGAAGGWGWSDLSGAVPDADDTPGALLALAQLRKLATVSPSDRKRIDTAARSGVAWLLDLQNRDGGWPTFCRGWGKLPFDRSGTDLTAHVLRALDAWRHVADPTRLESAVRHGFAFLESKQTVDSSWLPLWFGNQDYPREENPVYGTAKVLLAYRDLERADDFAAKRGRDWLSGAQNDDGGWGGERPSEARSDTLWHSSVEETALAVESLVSHAEAPELQTVVAKGLNWLIEAVESGRHFDASPIGLYFAKLWYHETLYPLTFTVAALRSAVEHSGIDSVRQSTSASLPASN